MSNTTLSPAKNTALSPRELSAAIYRLSDDRHAHADFALLKTLDPSTANDPQFTFSPRRYHPHILRALLALTTEQEILAARTQKATVPRSFAARPKKATVPGDSVAGQSPVKQKKTPSQKSKNTPKSTGKTSSTLTPSQQPSSTTTVSPPTGE